MKKNLTYLLSSILILTTCFLSAQETKVPATNRTIDSLLHVLKMLGSSSLELKPVIEGESSGLRVDTTMINTFNALSREHEDIGNYEQALQFAQKAQQQGENLIPLYKEEKWINVLKQGIAEAYNNFGIVYWNQGNYEAGLNNYLMCLKIYTEVGNKRGIANCYNNIGLIYLNQGIYENSLNNYLKALKIYEEIGSKTGVAICYNNIGLVYDGQGNCKKALDNFLQSLKIRESLGNKSGIASSLFNLGYIYSKQNDTKNALNFYLQSLKIKEEIGDKSGIASAYNNIGDLYLKQANADTTKTFSEKGYKKALEMFLKSLKINQELENIQGTEINYNGIGTVYMNQGNVNDAYDYLSKSLALSKEIGYKEGIKLAYSMLSELFEKRGDYKQAFEYKKLYSAMKDTLLNERSSKQITEMNALYESEKKDKEIQLLNKEKESQTSLTAAENRKQQVILLSVSGFSLLVMGFAMIIYRSYRQKQHLNTELEKSHDSIEKKNSKIIDSITYAQLIQKSILMEEKEILQHLPDSFVYYQPKDIVSGDFYWFSKVNDVLVLAAIDCTGHGVPGAFMSMIGNTLLNQIVNEKRHTKPSEILRLLNIGIYEALHQQKTGALSHDGMDLALCSIDFKNGEIQYAGAQNPIYVIFENNLEVLKADMHTIGGGGGISSGVDPLKRIYTNHCILIKKGMSIYLFSDGYMDQFRKHDRKKFGIQQFKDILLNNQHLDMQQQKGKIIEAFEGWKGTSPQIDDVLVIGIRL